MGKRTLGVSLAVLSFTLVSKICFAESIEVPEGDPLATLLQLILNFKALGPVAIAALVVTFVVQGLKKFFPPASSNVSRAIVTVLSVAYGIIQQVISGLSVLDSLVFVLLTMGGAVMIYEFAIKPFLPKSPTP